MRRQKIGRRALSALAVAVVFLAANSAPAGANHSWGNYHWARTSNPFTIKLGDNVSTAWDSYLRTASTDWSADLYGNPVDTTVAAGLTSGRKCRAGSGRVEVCNAAYGSNGWLGLASISISGSHITQATVKVNDSYFNTSAYNTPEWRSAVMCQEIGHTLGLDHQDESGADFHTCMDYASNPHGDNMHPNQHDYDQLAAIYLHTDSTTTIGSSTASSGKRGAGLAKEKEALYVEDLGNGKKRFVWVVWTDPGPHHGPPADA